MKEQEVTVRELWIILKINIKKILIISFMIAMLGGLWSKFFITPMYEASINMIVNSGSIEDGKITNDGITSSEKLVDTYAIIIKGNIVLNQVIENLGLKKDYRSLNEQIKVNAVNNTQVMKISVQDENLETAKEIVIEISKVAPEIIVESVEAGSCKVISQIESSTEPVTPNIYKNAAFSGIITFLIMIIFFMTRAIVNDGIEGESDVQKKLGMSVLGIIPEIEEEE